MRLFLRPFPNSHNKDYTIDDSATVNRSREIYTLSGIDRRRKKLIPAPYFIISSLDSIPASLCGKARQRLPQHRRLRPDKRPMPL